MSFQGKYSLHSNMKESKTCRFFMLEEELRYNYNKVHRISGACSTIILIILNNKVQVILNGCQGDRLWPLHLNSDLQNFLDTFLRILQL